MLFIIRGAHRCHIMVGLTKSSIEMGKLSIILIKKKWDRQLNCQVCLGDLLENNGGTYQYVR